MSSTALKSFIHPHTVYRLEHPAAWDQVIEKDGDSCGFGPHERDDVGLWISIMPVSVDTDRLPEDLLNLMKQALNETEAASVRRDTSLRHFGLVADITKDGQAGHYWIVAGGDVVLFASSEVPAAERDHWNPLFQQLMASLQITREDHLLLRKIANDVMAQLRSRHPDQEFKFEDDTIRGPNQVVYLSNLFREVRAAPARREQIIQRFVKTLSQPATADIGHEQWDECHVRIVPMLKPRDYLNAEGPTQHLYVTEWLEDVVIVYVIRSKKMFRFVTGWDLRRWEKDGPTLHDQAIANLARLPWPEQMAGSRMNDSGRVIVVDTEDSLASSRLLHPELHRLFKGPLGSPFWAGIPSRNTLVVYSDRKVLKQRIGRRLKKDHGSAAYPITPRPFMVTADGIAPAT